MELMRGALLTVLVNALLARRRGRHMHALVHFPLFFQNGQVLPHLYLGTSQVSQKARAQGFVVLVGKTR